jgi:putative tricarboxylic transport membrane protein
VHKDILRNGDVISAAVLAALGAYVFMQSREWAYYGDDGPGPAFFPAWYGGVLVALSLALIVSTITKQRAAEVVDWSGVRRALCTWLVFAACAAAMPWLGFLLSFSVLTFFLVAVIFRQSLLSAGLVALGTSAGFYVVFPLVLQVPLPTGFLGF